ncbi:DUF2806 domain-containing protein [Flavobacterium sp. LC2016-01]|uniref:DUF2806 domain-containing protein n=1 Tax=Flavobacterium sp. LC2016-01 TaxID=2675876 RepID=UPI0012BB14C6|nr:DUF2806 domain-containing protein [Flavobacterium sp. LC2016-01]MTH16626.1 DUF2806 domain-containing protein [Flavobacterium sp. LC2016-01]
MGEGSNFSLVKIEGKPLEKLIEVIGQGIGTLYRPTAIRKEAKAKAFEIEVLAKAQAIANAEGKLIDLETLNTIEQKIIYQQVKKQNNIDKIIDVAFDQVSQEPDVSSEKVDPDWTTRFFNIAEDISNDEMQKLWGRILAGEVKKPGTFSLRTLDLLKNLSKEEALVFTKFAKLLIKSHHTNFIPFVNKDFVYKQLNIPYKEILLMSELGLVITAPDLVMISKGSEKDTGTLFVNGDTGIYVESQPNNSQHHINIIAFTKTGSELATLITFDFDKQYIEYVCESLLTPQSNIRYGKLANIEGTNKELREAIEYKLNF